MKDYEALVGFRFNAFRWTDEERARYVEFRRYRWPRKIFSEASVLHLADAAGIIHWPASSDQDPWDQEDFPEGMSKRDRILSWMRTEFTRAQR